MVADVLCHVAEATHLMLDSKQIERKRGRGRRHDPSFKGMPPVTYSFLLVPTSELKVPSNYEFTNGLIHS
jgi:hypothetical protein